MLAVEMRKFKLMCVVARLDRFRKEYIRRNLDVAVIAGKIRENWLRWYGHVERKKNDKIVKKLRKT